jgi:hypothetical protein
MVQEIVDKWNLPYFQPLIWIQRQACLNYSQKASSISSKVVNLFPKFSQNKKSSFVVSSCLTYGKKFLNKYFKGLKSIFKVKVFRSKIEKMLDLNPEEFIIQWYQRFKACSSF